MKITKKNQLNRSYTLFFGEKIEQNAYSVQMALHHLLDHLLCCYLHAEDQVQVWCCEYTGKESLKEYCEKHVLDRETLKWIWQELLETLLETEEFLLDTDCLYLDMSEIYVEEDTHRISVCYVPFEKEPVWQKLTKIAQFLLGCLDQKDAQAVQMAYGIYRYLSQGGGCVDELWKLILRLEREKAEPVYEEIPAEILEEYQETVQPADQKKFPAGRWVIACLPIALAVFLLGFVALNEWYLSNAKKILLLVMMVVLGTAGSFLWRRWAHLFRKKRFLDEDEGSDGFENAAAGPRLVRKDTMAHMMISQIPVIIGKLPEKAQILIQEPTVSRVHAKIFMKEGEYYIEDLNSTNGTYLNGKLLDAQRPVRLKGNDELAFADICCYFQL